LVIFYLYFVLVDCAVLIFDFSLLLCRLQDVAGYGVAVAVREIYAAAFGERNFDSVLINLMVQNGRQGIVLQ
jgi:enoyl-CoA hydratase/3-hydroxyacyl-CoA dehydrogenase